MVDATDLKSVDPSPGRAGSSPAAGTITGIAELRITSTPMATPPTGSIALAVQHFRNGQLVEAALQCAHVLRRAPRDFEALHLLGVIQIGRAHV